ncbi:MAG: hypothetical protein RR672_07140, partial [Raoultibacter sp.]
MKKKLVAVGLAATLVLGTMPALAFGAPETGNKEFTNESGTTTGDTTVKVWTDTSNISAELPIDLVVYGPAEGGALTTPDTYAITNKSGFALDVKTAIATQTASQEADFTLANTSQSGTISPTGKIADLQIALTKKDGAKSWTIMKDGVAASDVLA